MLQVLRLPKRLVESTSCQTQRLCFDFHVRYWLSKNCFERLTPSMKRSVCTSIVYLHRFMRFIKYTLLLQQFGYGSINLQNASDSVSAHVRHDHDNVIFWNYSWILYFGVDFYGRSYISVYILADSLKQLQRESPIIRQCTMKTLGLSGYQQFRQPIVTSYA